MQLLKSQLESILFVSDKPVSLRRIKQILKVDEEKLKQVLDELYCEYEQENRGIRIIRHENKYQISASPNNSDIVEKFLNIDFSAELTKPSLETLSIIAYRGPIGKAELEFIRGVNCSLILRNLLMRGLVESQSQPKTGELRYKITLEFLRLLGISDAKDLPNYEKLNSNEILQKLLGNNDEDVETKDISNTLVI